MRSSELSDLMMYQYDICARCGRHLLMCGHPPSCGRRDITPEHALRIRAAYAIGKEHNPDHDTTSYYLQTLNPPPLES